MAKTSQINRNKKREKLVAQYAGRRAELKKEMAALPSATSSANPSTSSSLSRISSR